MKRDVHSQELQLSTLLDTQITKVIFGFLQYIVTHFSINMGQFFIINVPNYGALIIVHRFVCYTFSIRVDLEIQLF